MEQRGASMGQQWKHAGEGKGHGKGGRVGVREVSADSRQVAERVSAYFKLRLVAAKLELRRPVARNFWKMARGTKSDDHFWHFPSQWNSPGKSNRSVRRICFFGEVPA